MALKRTLTWLCSLAVLSFSATQHETLLQSCSSQTQLLEHLLAKLKEVVECGNNLPSAWSPQQTAELLLLMRTLTDTLHKHQLKECQGAKPAKCPEAEVPDNGGLACVKVANSSYCMPLCNYGYDFDFMRRSRLYDECSNQTGHKWQTQYIGGNKLAVCNKASIQVSGAKTAYFPQHQDCLKAKTNNSLQASIIKDLTTELKKKGIQGEAQYDCLVCG